MIDKHANALKTAITTRDNYYHQWQRTGANLDHEQWLFYCKKVEYLRNIVGDKLYFQVETNTISL